MEVGQMSQHFFPVTPLQQTLMITPVLLTFFLPMV
jgi:hypothetical protein